jgi:hypothetical protein
MPALRITLDGQEHVVDLDNLMLSELEVLEEHAGVDLQALNNTASMKSIRFVGHFLWLVKLRREAAEQDITLVEAALKSPRSGFDVAVGGLSMELVDGPKDQTARTTATRTPPAGSSRPRKRSAKSASARSASSPSA